MCIEFTSDIYQLSEDLTVFKVVNMVKDSNSFVSLWHPGDRCPQDYPDPTADDPGVTLEYRLNLETVSSFSHSSGIYCFNEYSEAKEYIDDVGWAIRDRIAILEGRVPKGSYVRHGQIGVKYDPPTGLYQEYFGGINVDTFIPTNVRDTYIVVRKWVNKVGEY